MGLEAKQNSPPADEFCIGNRGNGAYRNSGNFIVMSRKKPKKLAGGPVSRFIQHHYRHFNAASLVDAAQRLRRASRRAAAR